MKKSWRALLWNRKKKQIYSSAFAPIFRVDDSLVWSSFVLKTWVGFR
jgi:hypothetical protein